MSYYSCPNFVICNEFVYIKSSTSSDPIRSQVKLKCTPVYNSDTETYDLSIDNCELPVCWHCKASYNEEGDDETNKYLSFNDSIECCICLNKDYGVSFPNCELPVCWHCKASYNEEGDDETNKYLSFNDSIECCICLNKDYGVSFPNCQHFTCVPCHNRCWFGPKPKKVEFPYPLEIEKLYKLDSENEIWKMDPKIVEYLKLKYEAEDNRMSQWYTECNLRKCPVCRS